MKLAVATCLLGVVHGTSAVAQEAHPWIRVGARAVVALTSVSPTPEASGSATELRVVHPIITAQARSPGGRVKLVSTLNLDGWTIPNGELTPGIWGEGFIDRRHPHTYVHELMVVARTRIGRGLQGWAAAGKGFAPFGTDDPMGRPPLRFPVNHHLAQIPERAVALVAVERSLVKLEAALFNGDEPETPGQWPRLDRFGDSWSIRLSARPLGGLELQGSHAVVESPEHRAGGGLTDRKWSVSARWSGSVRLAHAYGLVEWERSIHSDGAFTYVSGLAEGAITFGPHHAYLRLERSDRPEEERVSAYRTVRPPRDDDIMGITRWTIATLGYGWRAPVLPRVSARSFIEVSLGRIEDISGIFDSEVYYGSNSFRSLTLGLRLSAGARHDRMGQYVDTGNHHH